jgi:hypothetical protein
MDAIFLSASVPIAGRGNYYETADPFFDPGCGSRIDAYCAG